MRYNIIPRHIPQSSRETINGDILNDIKNGKNEISKESIYNSYTGLGGLHGLRQEDFSNYHEYAQAKKEFEAGQFFTPHGICRDMVGLVSPAPSDMVLDICCGMGNFFNHLPNHFNAYGIDIDEDAVRVAGHLYPDANVSVCDIRQYIPEQGFDIIFGNPPFNLDFEGVKSQVYYFHKAYWALNPGGLLVAIVPRSFLQNENWNKRNIANINRDFSFIGQCELDPGAFASLGISRFETKIMAFARESQHIEIRPYKADEFIGMQELKIRIEQVKGSKQEVKLKIIQEANEELTAEEKAFRYKLDKYLYELKTHKHLKPKYNQAIALVAKFRNQKPPVNPTNEQFREWEKSKLTYAKVLAVLKRYIKDQDRKPRKDIGLVRTGYGYKLKAYAPRMLDGITKRYVPFYDLTANGMNLPDYKEVVEKLKKHCLKDYRPKMEKLTRQYAAAYKEIKRKRREFNIQHEPFESMQGVPELDEYIDSLTFKNKELETCRFLGLQKKDMSLVFQKRYALLNWQQGSGKTAVLYHFGKYQLGRNRVKNMVVLAPANAIEMTWEPFLKRDGEEYTLLEKQEDIRKIQPGGIVLVKLSKLNEQAKGLKQYMKRSSHKICLVFDECDEITNPSAARTRACLNVFRKAKYKILGTGTTTRNNITELYPQLELLYNNSCNFISYCDNIYHEDKERHIVESANPHYLEPFPPRGGANLFKACFCPGKATVFGIERHNQDVYNKDLLHGLISKTVITRKFKEFAGEKYTIYSHHVSPAEAEKQVYSTILEEFHRICGLYFSSTGDSRKDSQLVLIRQIQLLIKACSTPNILEGYYGDSYPQKAIKIKKLISRIPGKVAVGCTSLDSLNMYGCYLEEEFPCRPVFIIKGDVPFKRRQKILDRFESTANGILICTQQSLKSSVNIPSCNDVIMEALQWNIPKMEQFYFRFIRLDSKGHTNVHFVTYRDSIEQNLMALVLAKEQLNEFIKTGEVKEQEDIYEEFNISPSIIDSLLRREEDEDGKFTIRWGQQQIS